MKNLPATLGRLRHSVRARLMGMLLIVTTLVLLFAGTALLIHDLSVYRKSFAQDVSAAASILATSTAPAMAFDDHAAAQLHLSSLRARHDVQIAAVYDAGGHLYESYVADGVEPAATALPGSRSQFLGGERVEVRQRIEQNGEFLGTVYLVFHYDLRNRVVAYLQIFAGVIIFGLLLALLLSYSLQATITRPLAAIAQVARQVVEKRDYSLRVPGRSDDEIGIVISGFNRMLDEVRAQTTALTSSNSALTAQIAERQAAEEQRRQSEKVYRAVGESIDFGIWITDAEGRCTYASDSFLKLTGLTQEQCDTFGWTTLLHPEDLEATLAAWQSCVRTNGPWYREHRILGVDGQYHPVLAQGVPVLHEDDSIQGWAGINLDISRLKQTEEALRLADRRKDEFLATLAHELRNPLAPIRNAAELLSVPSASEQQRQWSRDVIARQVNHMALLLDDLLDVSRITRGRMELRREFVRLSQIVNAAIETARPLIEARRHSLAIHLPPGEDLGLNVDPLRLSQAMSNLLTNAAKYTAPGGRITLTAAIDEGGLRLDVADTGIGLAPGAASRIFEMFTQVEGAAAHSQGGLGIGLALVRGLVELHGGTVTAASAGLDLGSCFNIRLPPSALISHMPDRGIAPEGLLAATGGGHAVLVVDDNRDGADSLGLMLNAMGYAAHVAYGGESALQLAERLRPRIAILDIGMPDLDGYEVARRLRSTEWGRRMQLVALTGWGQKEDIDRAREAGFDLHLTKPLNVAKLQRYFATIGGLQATAASSEPRSPA